jgi:hypothetical protein
VAHEGSTLIVYGECLIAQKHLYKSAPEMNDIALPHIVTFLRFHVWVLMLRNPSLCKFRKRHLQEVSQAASSSQYETDVELATIVASKLESNGLHNDETNAELANQKSEIGQSLSSSIMKENFEMKSEVSALKTEILELKALLESKATGLKISAISRPND